MLRPLLASARPRRLRRLPTAVGALALLLAAVLPTATAQADIRTVGPDYSAFTVHLRAGGLPSGELLQAMRDLNAAEKFAAVFPEEGSDALQDGIDDLLWGAPEPIWLLGSLLLESGELLDELTRECPAAADPVAGLLEAPFTDEVFLSVAMDPFGFMPELAVALRFTADAMADVDAAGSALIDCLEPEVLGEQDGVSIYLMDDGGDMPLLFARSGDLWLIGSRPESIRGAIRRTQGSDEPSFADSPFGAEPLGPSAVRVTLSPAVIAPMIERMAPVAPDDEAGRLALNRLLGVLRTVPAAMLDVEADADGLVFRSAMMVDEAAGDAELAALLRCDGCGLPDPRLVPVDATGVSAGNLQMSGWVDWLDGLLADVSAWQGMETTLRGAMRDFLAIDLDDALLSWIGDEWILAELEPFSGDVRTLIGTMPYALLLPVDDADAAVAGVHRFVDAIIGGMDAVSAFDPDIPSREQAEGWLAFSDLTIAGIDATRLRFGFGSDLTIAAIDGHLVIAGPPAALQRIAAVAAGATPTYADSDAWRDASAGSPHSAVTSDLSAHLSGLADLADTLAQPLAFFMTVGLVEATSSSAFGPSEWDDGWDFDDEEWWRPEQVDLAEAFAYEAAEVEAGAATVLSVPSSTDGTITGDEPVWSRNPGNLYRIEPTPAGTAVEVEMLSPQIDTYLVLITEEAGGVIQQNDDAPDTDRSLLRYISDGVTAPYVVATTFSDWDEGDYTLNVYVEAMDDVAADEPLDAVPDEDVVADDPAAAVPSFADVLALMDLGHDALAILAERSGMQTGATDTDGDVVRSVTRVPLRW